MKQTQDILAKRLLYLPLDLNEKILLWLTYKRIKPVSEITVVRRNFTKLKLGIRTPDLKNNDPRLIRIKKWIKDANLKVIPERNSTISWHVGKDVEKVKRSVKIIRKYDYDSEIESGKLFGFPEKSVEAYAKNRVAKSEKEEIPMEMAIYSLNPFFKNKKFTQYAMYSMRTDSIKEESEIAKKWARCIQKDVPTLAKWFEKHEIAMRISEQK